MKIFTALGFEKIKTPEHVFKPISEFYKKNKDKQILESKDIGDTTNNYWESPSYLLDTAREDLIGGGDKVLQDPILNEAGKILSKWFNIPLRFAMMYGIRTYTDGAILNPHVDDLPRIASAIINVAQSEDCDDWPLEVIGHDGLAYNVTMKPGDMVLYESHSVIHGRPFPLSGKKKNKEEKLKCDYYANLFVHFEPDIKYKKSELPMYITDDVLHDEKAYKEIMKELDDFTNNSEDSDSKDNSKDDSKDSEDEEDIIAHTYAATKNLRGLRSIAKKDKSKLLKKDINGWTPLHEAVRAGDVDIINYLLNDDVGADLYDVTYNGLDVFDLAEENREIYDLLRSFENAIEDNEEF